MTVIYFTGRYAPGGRDWMRAYKYEQTNSGVYVWANSYSKESIFFPWFSVERIGG